MTNPIPRSGSNFANIRTLLLCGVAIGLMPATAAYAEEASEAAGEVIVVTGARPIAESEAAALEVQKHSDSLVSVAASDSVGRLPDQNIAQATGRLPGVAVERDQGQARYISLRGAPNYWTTLSLRRDQRRQPRRPRCAVRFDPIGHRLADRRFEGGDAGHAGRNGFGQRQHHHPLGVRLSRPACRRQSWARALPSLATARNTKASLVLSNRFKAGDGEIGVLVSGSYYKRDMVTDNFEIDYERVAQDQRPGWRKPLLGA